MEVFSPPRVIPHCRGLGLSGHVSIDITTGTDLSSFEGRAKTLSLLRQFRPMLLYLSPPCTYFSPLQYMWNQKKMDPAVWEDNLRHATDLLEFAIYLAHEQAREKRCFIIEHPARARSWQLPQMQQLAEATGAFRSNFHQCRFGLCAPGADGPPMKKETSLLSNALETQQIFHQVFCNCTVPHCRIQGSVAGVQLSSHAALYPEQLCHALASVALALQLRLEQGQ